MLKRMATDQSCQTFKYLSIINFEHLGKGIPAEYQIQVLIGRVTVPGEKPANHW